MGVVVRRVLQATVSLALAGVLFGEVLPRAAGVPWRSIGQLLGRLSWTQVALLAALWFLGLYVHSFVLTTALPRLTHRRALTLNLTGSAVSNILPMGGALGMALNYAMARSWGFSRPAFTLYTLVTNLWNVLAKLSLPAVALAVLLLTGNVNQPTLTAATLVALGALAALVVAMTALLASERAARRLGRAAGSLARVALRLVGRGRPVALEESAVQMRSGTVGLLASAWPRLSLGMLGYSALQFLLLWTGLHLLGSTLTPAQVFAGYALERVLTMAVLTPGGAGVVEVGMTALLVALGGAPAVTAAGVLLYRAFTFGLEVPVGGTGLLVWLWRRRAAAGPAALAGGPTCASSM